jgi:hypothetical protein
VGIRFLWTAGLPFVGVSGGDEVIVLLVVCEDAAIGELGDDRV